MERMANVGSLRSAAVVGNAGNQPRSMGLTRERKASKQKRKSDVKRTGGDGSLDSRPKTGRWTGTGKIKAWVWARCLDSGFDVWGNVEYQEPSWDLRYATSWVSRRTAEEARDDGASGAEE